MSEDDARVGASNGACGLDVLHVAQRQRTRAHHAHGAGAVADRERHDDHRHCESEGYGYGHCDDDARKYEHGVNQPLSEQVEEFAEVGACDAEHRAEGDTDQRGHDADEHGHTTAVQQATDDIAS